MSHGTTTIHLSDRYPGLTRFRDRHGPRLVLYLVLHLKGFALPTQSLDMAVGSCPTFSPLPGRSPAVCFLWHFPCRGIWSATSGLSAGLPALRCPDFPPRSHGAAVRLQSPHTNVICQRHFSRRPAKDNPTRRGNSRRLCLSSAVLRPPKPIAINGPEVAFFAIFAKMWKSRKQGHFRPLSQSRY